MTTQVLELFDDAMGMILFLARQDPQGFLGRVGQRGACLISVCAYCCDVVGFKDAAGMPGGLSHTVCPPCGTELRAETARYIALRTRN